MNSRLFRFDFDRTHFGDHGLESSTISCPADTLYSALCVEALRMGGQQLLGELVACSTLRLTDLLPYVGPDYLVPKPLHSVRSDGSSMQKKLAKKIGCCVSGRCGWSQRSAVSTIRSGQRSVRSPVYLVLAARRRCVSGCARRRSMPAHGPGPRPKNPLS